MKTLIIDKMYVVILDQTYQSETMGTITSSKTIVRVIDEESPNFSWYCEYYGVTNGIDLLKNGSLYLADTLEKAKEILGNRSKEN